MKRVFVNLISTLILSMENNSTGDKSFLTICLAHVTRFAHRLDRYHVAERNFKIIYFQRNFKVLGFLIKVAEIMETYKFIFVIYQKTYCSYAVQLSPKRFCCVSILVL